MVTALLLHFLLVPPALCTQWHIQTLFVQNFPCYFAPSRVLGSIDKDPERYLEV